MANRQLVGKVIDTKGQPVTNSEVWLSMSGGITEQQTTAAAGEFTFDLSDAAKWPPGTATLRVLPQGSPLGERLRIQIPETGSPQHVLVNVHSKVEISAPAGRRFLAVTVPLLLIIGLFYLWIHGVTLEKLRLRQPIGEAQPIVLSVPLADMLRAAQQQVASARESAAAATGAGTSQPNDDPDDQTGGDDLADDTTPDDGAADDGTADDGTADDGTADDAGAADGGAGEPANPRQQALKDAMVGDSLKTAAEIFAGLKKSRVGLLEDDKTQALDGFFDQADAALEAGAIDALDATLDLLLDQVEEERFAFLWENSPGRLLEVMFWALAATLLRLIFNAGQFLYKSSFLVSAIPQHIAFIIIIPIVAVIIAFVLTLVSVDIELGENALVLDMGNVLISIVVAALIGLAPWESWNFLHKLADLLFTTLAGFFKMGDRSAGG